MKLVSFKNNTFHLYSNDDVMVYEKLPAGYYRLEFNPMSGYSIKRLDDDFEVHENVYGSAIGKVDKVMKSYKLFNRNLGVLLSGDKGIGKSMFARLLAINCVKNGIPVINISDNTPGLETFLNDLNQEVMILFDEFDKKFGHDDEGSQAQLLSLFDGVSSGKRLFVITCNHLYDLNDFLVNRPGRFHYHFRFNYPTPEEVREYMQDKLDESKWGEIDNVVTFSEKTDLNYDCLRSIAFELSNGLSFSEAIKDLNITAEEGYINYDITCYFNNGQHIIAKNINMDILNDDYRRVEFCIGGTEIVEVQFNISAENYLSSLTSEYVIKGKDLTRVTWGWSALNYDDDYDEEECPQWFKAYLPLVESGISKITIRRSRKSNIHYTF